ncbi:DNA polymerase IV [Paenibacillus sp. D51F]
MKQKVIMLVDAQSFYASVEKAAHPEYEGRPLVVAGDPSKRSGIILAACPLAKKMGVTTAETIGDALGKCPELVTIRPRMTTYIQVSLMMTDIFEAFTDLVEPFSIDEQFLDVTGSLKYFGTEERIARLIQDKILLHTGVWTRVGIGANKIRAKMATDMFAKKNESGIFTLSEDNMAECLWPQPVENMFGVGSRMRAHFARMNIHTIGDLAHTPLPELKTRMRRRFGRNSDIQAEVFWQTANGIDPSPVRPTTHDAQAAVGHGMTLPRDYGKPEDINVVLMELSEEVCRRSRSKGYMGRVVSVGARGADFDFPTGFSRQTTLWDSTNISSEVYEAAKALFHQYWDGLPIRQLSVTLGGLTGDEEYQLSLFGDREQKRQLARTTDWIKDRYGSTAILRASSLLQAGQAIERSVKIGGHSK